MSTEPDGLDPQLADAISRLQDHPPTRDLWPGIAPKLTKRHPPGTFVLRWPVALAAGIAVAVLSATGTVVALRKSTLPPAAPMVADAAPEASATPQANAMREAKSAMVAPTGDSSLVASIADLEKQLDRTDRQLDARTRQSVRQSLAALDQAISDIETLRQQNPASVEVAQYLTTTLQRKLDVLRSIVVQVSSGT